MYWSSWMLRCCASFAVVIREGNIVLKCLRAFWKIHQHKSGTCQVLFFSHCFLVEIGTWFTLSKTLLIHSLHSPLKLCLGRICKCGRSSFGIVIYQIKWSYAHKQQPFYMVLLEMTSCNYHRAWVYTLSITLTFALIIC